MSSGGGHVPDPGQISPLKRSQDDPSASVLASPNVALPPSSNVCPWPCGQVPDQRIYTDHLAGPNVYKVTGTRR